MTNHRRDELVQQVKDAATALEMAANALRRHDPNIKIEFDVTQVSEIGRSFYTEKLQVKLTEVKTL